jgi:AP endonuclease 1
MPPKRAAASKRKLEEDSESEADAATSEFASDANDSDAPSTSKPKAKKAKTTKAPKAAKAKTTKAAKPINDQPTNKTLPDEIQFPAKNEGCVRIATWNICGLAAAQKKVRRRRSF